MEDLESGSIQLELKYCERCGGLWLRLKDSDAIFCPGCAKAMAGLDAGRLARAAKPARSQSGLAPNSLRAPRSCRRSAVTQVEPIFWTEGGNA